MTFYKTTWRMININYIRYFWNSYNFLTKKDISMEQIVMDYIKIEDFGNNLGG